VSSVLVAALLIFSAPAQSHTEEVSKRLTQMRSEAKFPGMTAAWTGEDGVTYSVGIGVSDQETNELMAPRDRMLAGSIGKMFFGAAIMKMVERGQLDLNKKVSDYLGSKPWYSRIPNAQSITLLQLLTHQSGIPEHVESPAFVKAVTDQPTKNWTPDELLSFVLDKEPLFEAGKGWSYADTNYILAACAAETVSQKPLYTVIEEQILKPLVLADTLPSISPNLPGLVQGYSMPNSPFGFSGPVLTDGKYRAFNPQMEWAGGGFLSTAADLSRWAKALYEGRVVSQASVQTMIDSAVPAKTGAGDKYGIATQVRTSPYGPSWGHGGWFPGYLSEVEYFPDLKLAVAVQFNTDDMRALGGRPTKFTREIVRLLQGSTKTDGTVR
jgi:D-alanyl-D-alanine carboxypeptidase